MITLEIVKNCFQIQYSNQDLLQAELVECLERDGFKSILEAVGADYRQVIPIFIARQIENSVCLSMQARKKEHMERALFISFVYQYFTRLTGPSSFVVSAFSPPQNAQFLSLFFFFLSFLGGVENFFCFWYNMTTILK